MQRDKFKISNIFIIMVMIILVMASIVGVSMTRSSDSLVRLQENTDKYINLRESISSMTDASDFLTEQCRSFVATGDKQHLLLYFNEINVDKRRDKAAEVITEYENSHEIKELLDKSLKISNDLTVIEMYSMKLASLGHHVNDKEVDAYLKDVKISAEDMALDDNHKLSKAILMLFDEEYNSYKTAIRQGVFDSLENLIENTKSDQLKSYTTAAATSRAVSILFFITLILTGILLLVTAVSLIDPMRKSVLFIRNNDELPLRGSYEYAFLADTYNKMLDKNRKHSEFLSYEATHDELTGLYNRKMFESKREEFKDLDTALILVDVDHFKEINDTYGHELGDKILKKVADSLLNSFRNEDYVCRIGGDEFAVIMVQMKPELEFVIRSKVDALRETIDADDGLPKVTLSIGSSFTADSEDHEELFRNADAALYKVKNTGRNGFAFFSEVED